MTFCQSLICGFSNVLWLTAPGRRWKCYCWMRMLSLDRKRSSSPYLVTLSEYFDGWCIQLINTRPCAYLQTWSSRNSCPLFGMNQCHTTNINLYWSHTWTCTDHEYSRNSYLQRLQDVSLCSCVQCAGGLTTSSKLLYEVLTISFSPIG